GLVRSRRRRILQGLPALRQVPLPTARLSRAEALEAGAAGVSQAGVPALVRSVPLSDSCDRQGHPHGRPSPQCAVDAERTPVSEHDVLDDRQPEARASELPRASAVDAVEALRQSRDVLLGDADAVVTNGDLDRRRARAVDRPSDDADAASLSTVLDRVVDEVDQHLLETIAVAENRRQAA